MGQLTPQGYVADTFNDIFNQFITGLKGIYGDDILVDPDDPDGQLAGILAQMRADIEGTLLAIYQANDPDNATGAWLEQKVAYAGLERRAAQYSYLRDVALTGSAGGLIKSGVILRDDSGIQWVSQTDVTLDDDGNGVQDFRSQTLGQYQVAADVPLTIVTVVAGWQTAVTQYASETGLEEETDPQLLARFYRSRSKPAVNCVDGTVADIYALPDVSEVVPLENSGDMIDVNGVKAHTVNYVVDGGDNSQIAKAIYRNWPGTGLQGDVSIAVTRYSGNTVDIQFDRPVPVDVATEITVGRRKNFTYVDTSQIVTQVLAMQFAIGESVYQADVSDVVNQTSGVYVKSILLGRESDELTDVDILKMAAREKARFLSGNVTVTVVDE
jgi:uncharacterized phage protein gp47/JayE